MERTPAPFRTELDGLLTLQDLRFTRPVETIRTAVAAAVVHPHPPAGDDIHIVSSPRSGSTWFMEALGSQPGFGCVNEPLHKRRLDLLPDPGFTSRWRYDEVRWDEAEAFKKHLSDRASLRPFLNIHPLRDSFTRRPDRLVIKTVRAAPILPWLVANVPGHFIYLCRHPIPQAISAQRREHAVRGWEYFERARRGRHQLGPDVLNRLEMWLANGDELTHRVVEWSLENLTAVRFVLGRADQLDLTVVRYEDVVGDFGAVLRRLDKTMNLPDWAKSLPAAAAPSRVTNSSTTESIQAIKKGNSSHLIRGWRDRISEDRVRELLEIPRLLGIPLQESDDSVEI